jgi:hypothetical protein
MTEAADDAKKRRRASVSISRAQLVVYGVAFALAITATVLFGWAGFWLGLALLVVAKVGLWAAPLVKLSYRDQPKGS